MYTDESKAMNLDDYKMLEINLHREIMNSLRRYINDLSIVSIIGILEIVRQEAIELEHATKKNVYGLQTEEDTNEHSSVVQ